MGRRLLLRFSLALVLCLTFSGPAVAVSDPAVGSVLKIEGRVDVTVPGTGARPAIVGQPVRVGDILRTKSRSRAEIRFVDGSIMRLAESSRVAITRYMVKAGQTDGMLHLFRGKIQTIISKSKGFFNFSKRNRFEVHTTNAVCGVRGTNYFSAYVNGTSDFIFKEGRGYGYNKSRPGQVAEVLAGQALQVAGPDRPPRLRQASQAELDAHGKDTEAGDGDGDDGSDGSDGEPSGAGEGDSNGSDDEAGGAGEGDSNGSDGEPGGTGEGEKGQDPGPGSGGDGGASDDDADLYTDGAVPGAEVFSDDIFTVDGAYSPEAMDMLIDIFGPDSMLIDPVVPWEQETVNPGLTIACSVAGSLGAGLQFKLYGTWDPDQWRPPKSFIEMVDGALDASHPFFVSPGGFWLNGRVAGGLIGLWVGEDGGSGLLTGEVTGAYAADGTWETGFFPATSIDMTAPGAAAFAAADPIPDPMAITYDYVDEVGRTFDSGTGTITVKNPDGQLMGGWVGIPGQDWGVFRSEINGTFTDGVSDSWHLAYTGAAGASGLDKMQWVEIEGSQWSGGEIHGAAVGAWIDLDQAVTGVLGGPVAGVFDPSDPKNIWDLVIGGAWLSTDRFLEMAGKVSGTPDTAALDAMGIPRFEVGRTDLAGTDGNLDVQINDMIFFAPAAAQKPAIWASGSVSGNYAADPSVGAEVLLSGSGFSDVRFSVERWDGAGGKWGAEVTGAGQMGGHSVTVVGGAAGAIQAAGSFTGTAAGVAGNGP